jgi:hypothetical protein
MEDLGCHAVGLQLVHATPGRTGCDTSCILTTICCPIAPLSLFSHPSYIRIHNSR